MNLKQPLARGKLKQFAKEHENPDPHPMGKGRFDALMDAMVKGKPPKPEGAHAYAQPQARGAQKSGRARSPHRIRFEEECPKPIPYSQRPIGADAPQAKASRTYA